MRVKEGMSHTPSHHKARRQHGRIWICQAISRDLIPLQDSSGLKLLEESMASMPQGFSFEYGLFIPISTNTVGEADKASHYLPKPCPQQNALTRRSQGSMSSDLFSSPLPSRSSWYPHHVAQDFSLRPSISIGPFFIWSNFILFYLLRFNF